MNKKKQRELIKKQLSYQKDKADMIICGSAKQVIVTEKINGVWKQTGYPVSKQ